VTPKEWTGWLATTEVCFAIGLVAFLIALAFSERD
jgi:hypothetical protein